MKASEKIDYVFGLLEGDALTAFEREMAIDLKEADSVHALRTAVDRLVNDRLDLRPPRDLVSRTLAIVNETRKPKRTILDFVPVAVPYRWTDFAVAASIFFAAALTLMPAMQRSRERMQQAGCGYNLQQLGRALWQYDNQAKHFPIGTGHEASAHTGTYAVLLNDNKLLDSTSLLDCPCNGRVEHHKWALPDFKKACELSRTDPKTLRAILMPVEYAYNVGYVRPEGRVGPVQEIASSTLALLADQPSHRDFEVILAGNSVNHGGRGQNVLFSDLHVGWHNTRRLTPEDADMFLNADHKAAPGRHSKDAAMLPSFVPFSGWPR